MEKIVQTAGRDALGEFAPAFARYNDDILFGEDWNDPCIDHKLRCIITLVALVSAGVTDSSLQYHLENAKRAGVTREEIAGVITHTAFYAGWPKAWDAVFWTCARFSPTLRRSRRNICALTAYTPTAWDSG